MADMNFERFEGNRRAPTGGTAQNYQSIINFAGAITSVALVLGLAVWGYKLAVRDVSGIPVVLAMQGPMRVAPDAPGGSIADNQGLAVNTIAAEGNAAPPADRLVLAPPAIELSADDAPGLSSLAPAVPADDVDALLQAPMPTDVPATDVQPMTSGVDENAIEQALAAALTDGGDVPVTDVPLTDDPVTDAAQTDQAMPATDGTGTVVRSPRPMSRPTLFSTTIDSAANDGTDAVVDVQDAVSVASPEMLPEDVIAGTRLVQLGAFDTADGARAEWTKLQGRFGDLMAGKAIIVQPATSGGQTFFRLRAFGFSDENDSRRFCSALLSEDTSCIPVTHR